MNCDWCGAPMEASRPDRRFCGGSCEQANREWCQTRAVALLGRVEHDPHALTGAFAEACHILGDLHGRRRTELP